MNSTASKLEIFTAARNAMAMEILAQQPTHAVKLYGPSGNLITPDAWYSYRKQAAGRDKSTYRNWAPQRQFSVTREAQDRETIVARSVDLTNNDPHASGVVDTFATTVAGSGLTPIPALDTDLLPYEKEKVRALQVAQRNVYRRWYPFADATRRLTFGAIQYLCIRNLIEYGEYLILLYMIEDPFRPYHLACHVINPQRLKTPVDKINEPNIRDGIEIGPYGEPAAYWIKLSSPNGISTLPDSSENFRRIPAAVGHRLNVIHRFISREPEQIRGLPAFTSGMKFFRDFTDYLETELWTNLIASAISMFIELPMGTDPMNVAANLAALTEGGDRPGAGAQARQIRYQEFEGGTIMYGNTGEKPHLLSPNRPGTTFDPFTKIIKKGMALGLNLPYAIAFKDTDGVNFAGFRSVMLDAWRVFMMYRTSLAEDTCQKIYTMLQEEAYLKGEIDAKEFYEFREAITRADWRGSPKGDIEPIKAAQADALLIQNNLKTRADSIAERGGDLRATLDQLQEEQEMMKERGLTEEKIESARAAEWAEKENENDDDKKKSGEDTVDDENNDENNMEQS